jgi:hypothetical protein
LRYYQGDNNSNVQTLYDILMTYCMYNFDLGMLFHFICLIIIYLFTGYVQGMSDFLSPILVVMDNEVDAFWCFVALMKKLVNCFCFLKIFSFLLSILLLFIFAAW